MLEGLILGSALTANLNALCVRKVSIVDTDRSNVTYPAVTSMSINGPHVVDLNGKSNGQGFGSAGYTELPNNLTYLTAPPRTTVASVSAALSSLQGMQTHLNVGHATCSLMP